AHLGVVQVRERRHVLTAIVQPLQQGGAGLLRKLLSVSPADVHTGRFHSLHDERDGRRPNWVNDRVDFRRSALARFAVASLAIQTVQVCTVESYSLRSSAGRQSPLPEIRSLSRQGWRRPQ